MSISDYQNKDFAIGIVGRTDGYIDMPQTGNKQQVSRKQTTAIYYKQTDDGEYDQLDMVEAQRNVEMVNNKQIHAVYQQGTLKSSTCSKTRLVLVACLLITIIAVISVTVVAVLYKKQTEKRRHDYCLSQDNKTTVGPSLPSTTPDNKDLKLDISSSHKDIFASSNRTMMSNIYFDGSITGPGKRPLMNYKGILADRSILKGEQLDIHFKVEYKIIKEAMPNNLIFDFAMCSLCDIDKHWYGGLVDINCWNMHVSAHNNTNSFQLYFQDNGKYSSNKYFVSSANVGTTKIVSYDIHVSGRTNSISYNDLSGKHFNTFTNVNFTEPLYILFGLYNSAHFQSVFQFI